MHQSLLMNILGANETAFMWWLALKNALEEEKGGTKKNQQTCISKET